MTLCDVKDFGHCIKGVLIFLCILHYDSLVRIVSPTSVAYRWSDQLSVKHDTSNERCDIEVHDNVHTSPISMSNATDVHTENRSSLNDDYHESDFMSTLEKFRLSHPKNIITGHLNINSMRNKVIEISELMDRNEHGGGIMAYNIYFNLQNWRKDT